jgi:hypothetical protein
MSTTWAATRAVVLLVALTAASAGQLPIDTPAPAAGNAVHAVSGSAPCHQTGPDATAAAGGVATALCKDGSACAANGGISLPSNGMRAVSLAADGGGEVRCDALTPILLATIRAQRRLLARQDLQIRELAHRQLKVQAVERRGNGPTDANDGPQGTTPSVPGGRRDYALRY